MEAGDADAEHDSFGENKEFWTTDWVDSGNGLAPTATDRETTYLMFNNSKPPFDNADMRRALALCTNRDEYLAFRAPGNQIADGPFAEAIRAMAARHTIETHLPELLGAFTAARAA